MEYVRDAIGRVTEVHTRLPTTATPDVTRYQYDATGNVTRIVDPLGGTTMMTYDVVGRLSRRTLPNGVVTDWSYDLRDRVLSVTHRDAGGAIVSSFAYVRTPSGEPSRITREDGSYVELSYDAARRLASEQYYSGAGVLVDHVAHSYDRDGNRLTRAVPAGVDTYSYGAGNQLISIGGGPTTASFGHDPAGRVVSILRGGTGVDLAYDSSDQLVRHTNLSTGDLSTYTYDGTQRRVGTSDASGDHWYLVAPTLAHGLESPHVVMDSAGALVAGYVYAGERPLMRYTASGPVYYLEDGIGSVAGLADGTGAAVARFDYDSFGNIRSATGPAAALPLATAGDFRFHGMWLEPTGLYYVRARRYDAQTGRFLTKDPVEGELLAPETFNEYTFAFANPHVFRDPSGLVNLKELNFAQLGQQFVANAARASARAFLREFKEEVLAQVTQVAISALLPLAGTANTDTLQAVGTVFETMITGWACALLPAGDDLRVNTGEGINPSIYLKVAVDQTDGTPGDDGFGCDEIGAESIGPPPFRSSRPELLVSAVEPTCAASRSSRGLSTVRPAVRS